MSRELILQMDSPDAFVVEGRDTRFTVDAPEPLAAEVTGAESFAVVVDREFTVATVGQPGQRGPIGPVGTDLTYTHVQASPQEVWTVVHDLGKFPSVTVVDSTNRVVTGQVDYVDATSLVLTFGGAFSGKAYLN